MKYSISTIIVVFIIFSIMVYPTQAAKPADTGKDSNQIVQVVTTPVPSAIPVPTSIDTPETTPAPSSVPAPSPTSRPLPTTAPTAVPTQAPIPTPIVPTEPVKIKEMETKKKEMEESMAEIMGFIGDTPTPTPTPQPVEVIKRITIPEVPVTTEPMSSPVTKIQAFIAPSAAFFLRAVPGNYYLINSLSQTQTFSLFALSLLLLGSGGILLYKVQKQEIMRSLESVISTYLMPIWIQNKKSIYTIFDRDYAK